MVAGTQGESGESAAVSPKNGETPMRQRLPSRSPVNSPDRELIAWWQRCNHRPRRFYKGDMLLE